MSIQRILKRQIDFWGSLLGLLFLAIPFAIVALCIKIDSKGSVFFRQERVGRNGKVFYILKFRSMVQDALPYEPEYGVAASDPRVTRVGKALRRFSLDELPQLLHILKGEMSLVGPRPVIPELVRLYPEGQESRLKMRPGLATIVHLCGWNTLPLEERMRLEAWYVDHWSLWLDFKILFRILSVAIDGEGQYGGDKFNPREREKAE